MGRKKVTHSPQPVRVTLLLFAFAAAIVVLFFVVVLPTALVDKLVGLVKATRPRFMTYCSELIDDCIDGWRADHAGR